MFSGKLDREAAERASWFKMQLNLMKALRYRVPMEAYEKVIAGVPAE
jgi:hypothetical protein